MPMTGKCLCGAVSYTIDAEARDVGACHCGMCRAFSGGVFLGLEAKPDEVTLKGEDNLTIYRSSDWAERAFCKTCGASMFYRITAPGPMRGVRHFGAGTLDDWGDARVAQEIFIDKKPAGYAFAGDTRKMTEAEILAMFAPQK